MKVVIDIPKDFTGNYIADKFKDFFSRVIADIDCEGMCGRYEEEIAEMFLKAFDDSEEKISCNYQHNSNPRDNELCRICDGKQTNADKIRNMSDEELMEFIVELNEHCLAGIGKCNCSNEREAYCYDICKRKTMEWLQSEAE